MNRHHTVVDFPPVAIPLPADGDGLVAALGRAGLIHATDGVGMSMFLGHNLLAPISELLFIPLD
jgi:hypothetical protein